MRAPLARSTRNPAMLVVPRSTASPSVRLLGAAKSIASRSRRRTRTDQLLSRKTAGSCRAAARSSVTKGCGSASATRSASARMSDSVAAGTLTSWFTTAGSSGKVSTASPASTFARTIGAKDRSATSIVQSPRATSWQARSHRGRRLVVSCAAIIWPLLWRTSPCVTSTEQVPQVPRPPQAPTMRTPLRRAHWKMVSPGCVLMQRSSCGNSSARGGSGAICEVSCKRPLLEPAR